jgi:hypothetical protein
VATLTRQRRLVNPGKKRKLSALQKMFFGSKRQRAAVKANPKRRRRIVNRKRKRNVGSIITVWPKGHSNPGKRYRRRNSGAKNRLVIVNSGARMAKGSSGRVISGYGSTVMNKGRKRMATRRRRRVSRRRKANPVARRRVRRYRRRNAGTRVGRSWSTYKRKRRNPGVRHYRRRRHVIHNRRHARRNPGMLTGTAGRVLGVVGGVAVTKLLCGFLPASLATGVLGYLSTGAIAVLQGKLVGKFSKSPSLGNDMLVGGLAYLAAKVLNDFFPSIGSYTGISGMGLIGGSSFYNPQVNLNGQMGSFVVPAATMGAIAGYAPVQTSKGVGAMRRTGRLM